MGEPQRRVCVVGAGFAGLSAARFLLRQRLGVVVLEANARYVGGIWSPDPINRVVYRGLVTNIPKQVMQSFDLPYPEHLPSYLRPKAVGEYCELYADHFKLRPHIRLGCKVTRVAPLASAEADAAGAGRWRVQWRDPTGAAQSSEFDAVVVCTGHYEVPHMPEVAGAAEWLQGGAGRRLIHSRVYDSPEEFRGRSVLVVGGRSSGQDLAREIGAVGTAMYIMDKDHSGPPLRQGRHVRLPRGCALRGDGAVLLPSGDAVAGPPVQDLVLATGYLYDFPFLDTAELGMQSARLVTPLHLHIFHARRPSLSFIGVPLAVPAPLLLCEAQSRAVAACIARAPGCAEARLSTAERLAWVHGRLRACGDRPQDMHFLAGSAWEYVRDLAERAGDPQPGPERDHYLARLRTVERIYLDRVRRRPRVPWGDDWYRRCEYPVDWEQGKFEVVLPHDIPPEAKRRSKL
eukprot:TRINITY_DN5787_c0_g1_i1.p1 TRINITY_DN5787_c0_g1~~TRINITY_DN5787_c0_g1_i1.p1  ORF type:complete len:477 (+),score=90.68 TRINITY_DN5787_c0_g1_i1:56-1432(+)